MNEVTGKGQITTIAQGPRNVARSRPPVSPREGWTRTSNPPVNSRNRHRFAGPCRTWVALAEGGVRRDECGLKPRKTFAGVCRNLVGRGDGQRARKGKGLQQP